jgi:hypothetical protein
MKEHVYSEFISSLFIGLMSHLENAIRFKLNTQSIVTVDVLN